MNANVTEQELIDGARGERVTLADVEAAIISEHFFTARQGARAAALDTAVESGQIPDTSFLKDLGTLTICVLRLWNGFTVLGQSACADPKNFNEEIGKRLAKSDAVNKMWALMGYELKSRMARDERLVGGSPVEAADGFTTYIGTKVVHAIPMDRIAYNEVRGWPMPANESNDEGYLIEYADRVERIPTIPGMQGYVSWSPKEVFERAYRPVRSAKAQPAAVSAEGTGTASKETRLGEIILREDPNGKSLRIKLQYKGKPIGCFEEISSMDGDVDRHLVFLMEGLTTYMVKDDQGGKPEDAKMIWGTWQDRAKLELSQLVERYDKLEAFLRTDAFNRLPAVDRKDLYQQVNAMELYKHHLSRRLARQEALELVSGQRADQQKAQAQQFQNLARD
jgi:hypothetical protein